MSNIHADQLTFRAWLVKQLTLTRWTAAATTPPEELAVKLGVQPAVLLEALEVRRQKANKRGRGIKRELLERNDYALIKVLIPPIVHRDWVLFCGELRVLSSTVLRSIVHHFLLTREKPSTIAPFWNYRGKRYPAGDDIGPFVHTRVTRGAQVALHHYSTEWSVTTRALVRGLVTDMLEGRIRGFRPVAYSELWGDPDRYLHPEKFETMIRKGNR